MDAIMAAVDFSTVSTGFAAIALVAIGIRMGFKGLSIGKQAVKAV